MRAGVHGLDTTTACGEFVSIFAAVAQFERGMIRDRASAGLAAARARGHVGGRRVVTTAEAGSASVRLDGDCRAVCQELGISAATYYRGVKGKT
jgi:DNA invertase Pin-like site-specific DNA recombinase